jgi:hypothetical protein
MRFNLQTTEGEIVFRDIGLSHAYLTAYGTYADDAQPRVEDLPIDGITRRRYSLSGQKPTVYLIVRTA